MDLSNNRLLNLGLCRGECMKSIIELKQVKKEYVAGGKSETVLENLSYNFQEGVRTAILGSSGCGKSTLLNLIGGIDTEFEGELSFRGETIKDFDQYRREHISFIFQDLNLISHHSLIKNITLGLTNDVKNKEEIALKLLEKVGLSEHAHKKPHQLSGGERQRVAIARALARNSDVLLCDEPTGSLDTETRNEIMDLIIEVFKDKTLIFITHDEELAEDYSDIVLTIEDKKLVVKTIHSEYRTLVEPTKKKSRDRTFSKRFEINLLSKKLNLFNSIYLLVIIAAIFLFGIGVIQGVEREIDNYLYDKYKVDRLHIQTGRLTVDGFMQNTVDYNELFDAKIQGFMTGAYANISFAKEDIPKEIFLSMIQPTLKENLESDIVVGRFPESNNEILFSKGAALKTIYDYQLLEGEDSVALFERLILLTDEEIYNELLTINISYKNYCLYNQDAFYDNNLKIVGLIDDSQYYDTVDSKEPYMRNLKRYNLNLNTKLLEEVDGEMKELVYNDCIYMLEEEFKDFINEVYIGQNSLKLSSFYVFIEEEDLDLRNKVFDDFLLFKPLFHGNASIIEERASYYKEVKGYKVAIIGGCIIISIFAIVSLYNGLKTSIVRNRKNIGIYKSLGYTSKNIKYMFLLEGVIITGVVLVLTLIVWGGVNLIMNEHLVEALDPNRIIEMKRVNHLNLFSVVGIAVSVMLIILTSISKELRKVNIVSLLKH